MAKAADFDGKANETEVITPESVKGKRKTSILGKKARLWLITINNPQNHGISLEQAEILERFKEDIASGAVTYVSSVIEARLALIARQGRAFGIHLILATQRPDANILPGQIKNNMNIRICGRADTTLSTIIIGDGRAAEQIPHDAQGRFIMEDGTVFQAYYFNDDTISKW